MSDPPYDLDFLFSDIVDVHWGGNWVVVGIDNFTGGTIDFPGFSGGTPGIQLPTDITPFPGYPHALTAADIAAAKQQKTSGGMALEYFGVTHITASAQSPLGKQLSASDEAVTAYGYTQATHVFFKAPTSSKFKIRVNSNQGTVPGATIACWPLTSQTIKPGLNPPLPLPAVYPSTKQASRIFLGLPALAPFWAEFQIDPTTLSVKRTGQSS